MANMTAVYLPGDRRVDVRRVAVPEPGPDEVLVEIKASCICRSDLSLYYGNAVVGGEAAGRCITGHEPAGVVVKIGEAVRVRPRIIESGFVEFLMERLRVFPIFDARNELQR